jgi:hypothetical protein
MAVVRIVDNNASAGGATFTPAGSTKYLILGDTMLTRQTVEANAQLTMRSAGTLANLYVYSSANTITAASTVRTRLNAANGGQSVSIGSSATGVFEDTTHTDAIAAADKINYQVVPGASGTQLTIQTIGVTFSATTNTVKKFTASDEAVTFTTASVTRFIPLSGRLQIGSTESTDQYTARVAGTLTNLQVHISANARGTATTFGSRLNTATGALTVSVGIAGTGFFEDTTHTDTIASGDLVNYFLTTGTGTASMTIDNVAAEFTSTSGNFFFLGAQGGNSNYGTTANAMSALGGTIATTTTENNAKVTSRVAFTAGNLSTHLANNSITASSTVTFRQNGSNTALTVSIPSSTSGFFEDTVDTVSIATTDTINHNIVTGGTGSTLAVNSIGLTSVTVSTTIPNKIYSYQQAVNRSNTY